MGVLSNNHTNSMRADIDSCDYAFVHVFMERSDTPEVGRLHLKSIFDAHLGK